MEKRYIGISKRIPAELLQQAMEDLWCGRELNRDAYLQGLAKHFTGENRQQKVWGIIRKLASSKLWKIRENLSLGNSFYELSKHEQMAWTIAVLCSVYPFGYEMLCLLSTHFRVHDQVTRSMVYPKLEQFYGGTKAVDNAYYAYSPMLMELGLIQSPKTGFMEKCAALSNVRREIFEVWIWTALQCSSTKSIIVNELSALPWMAWITPPKMDWADLKLLRYYPNSTNGGWVEAV